jgi:hypothetical protein
MDLLRYSETVLEICFHTKTKREIHDVLRAAACYPSRMVVCGCTQDAWTRKTLSFLGVSINNEPSRECLRHGTGRELSSGTQESARPGDQHVF